MSSPLSHRRKGSALITVILLSAALAVLTASVLRYTISERRSNERQRLILRARNMAENISVYAAEQLTIKLMRLRNTTPRKFATGTNQIYLPPNNVLTTAYSAPSDMEVRAGLTTSTAYTYINPATDPTNPNAGLHVSTSTIPIIAKATMNHPQLGSYTAYCEHTMEVAMIPLFQFGLFYNMDLELFPGQAMTIAGPVHTNGRLMARGEIGGSATLTFTSRVTAAKGLYADGQMKVNYRNRAGSFTSGAGGTGAVNYTSSSGAQTNLYGNSKWRDHKFGGTSETTTTLNQFKTFATSTYTGYVRTNVHGVTPLELPSIGTYQETNDADTPEDDRNNGRQLIEPPNPMKYVGGTWTATTDSASDREAKISRKSGLYIVVNPDDQHRYGRLPDGSSVPVLAHTYRSFLNTVNTDGSHNIQEVILPGQPSYGYHAGADGVQLTNDDYMYQNTLPNRFCTNTSVGWNQVLRISGPGVSRTWDDPDTSVVTGGFLTTYSRSNTSSTSTGIDAPTLTAFSDSFFYDLRRATNWRGYPYDRGTYNYTPRPIAKIDFDMARFKMCVDRTLASTALTINSGPSSTAGYNVAPPNSTNWASSIYNPSASTATLNHGTGASFATYPASTTAATRTRQDPFRMYFAPANPTISPHVANLADNPSLYGVGATSLNNSGVGPWFDGITVYIHSVDAEYRGDGADAGTDPDRIDSGVRLLNGRGPVVSLTSATGLTFVTNDALYVIGHFNADGSINTTTTATGNGGYSARFADSANEKLTALMADAITLLSQPRFTSSGGNYFQVAGWNDALSAHAADNGDELTRASNWRTTNPSSSNEVEGEGSAKKPGDMPFNSVASTQTYYTTYDEKLPTINTEVSAALLMGLVPSNHNATGLTDGPPVSAANQQYSGGAHNFPRLLEDWHENYDSTSFSTLCIRGSMVALFESRVAMEPWNIRCYLAPVRVWGLHDGFAQVNHHVPLEPVVLNSRRMRYREMTAAEYASLKTTIEALPN
jgi:hypothetical protein